jgi:hypothetical protein
LLIASGIGMYSSFFAPQAKPKPAPPAIQSNQPASARPEKPAVVCGMTLLPARPVDSRMKIPTPDPKRFPMKTLEPQICRR